jgi:hypothetical protein
VSFGEKTNKKHVCPVSFFIESVWIRDDVPYISKTIFIAIMGKQSLIITQSQKLEHKNFLYIWLQSRYFLATSILKIPRKLFWN